MGKRFVLTVSEADKVSQSLSSIENAQTLKSLGSSYGRPKGAKSRSCKYLQIKEKVLELREQGLTIEKIAQALGVCKNTVCRALAPDEPSSDSRRQVVAFIRRQLKFSQSIVHDNGGDCSRYSDAFLLLDRLEQRM